MKLPFLLFAVIFFTRDTCGEDLVHNPIQYHSQNPKGSYNYGYDTGLFGSHSFHQENRDKHGQVRGRYGYTDPDGNLRLTYYSAGPQGFNVLPSVSPPAAPPPPVVPVIHTGPAYRSEESHVHVDAHPVSHPVAFNQPVAPCRANKPPCPKAIIQTQQQLHQDVHQDDKVSVSYSTSSKTSHQENAIQVVEEKPAIILHHDPPKTPPREHRHHHLHHRFHDEHSPPPPSPPPQIIPDVHHPVAPVVVHHPVAPVVHSTPVIHSNPVVIEEKTTHHFRSKTIEQDPIKAPVVAIKEPLIVKSPKPFYSPVEVYRTKTVQEQRVVPVTPKEYAKGRYVPNYKPAGQYSRCYCV